MKISCTCSPFLIPLAFSMAITLITGCSPSGGEEASLLGRMASILGFNDLEYINEENQDAYNLSGKCEGDGEEVHYIIRNRQGISGVGLIMRQEGVVFCESGRWTITDFSFLNVTEGATVNIEISQLRPDLAGSTAGETASKVISATTSVIKDTIIPIVYIDMLDEYITVQNQNSFRISGTCSEAGTLSLAFGASSRQLLCSNTGQWSIDTNLAGESEWRSCHFDKFCGYCWKLFHANDERYCKGYSRPLHFSRSSFRRQPGLC